MVKNPQDIFVDPSGFFNVSVEDNPVKDLEVDARILDYINTQLNPGFMDMIGKQMKQIDR